MKQYIVIKKNTAKKLKEATGITLLDLNYIFSVYFNLVKLALIEGKAVSFGDIATIRPFLKKHIKYNKEEKKLNIKKVKRLKINIKSTFQNYLDSMAEEALNIKPRDIV